MVPELTARLTWRDRVGGWGVRWGINRMGYAIEPGLYRLGRPDRRAPVLVTANYKLTVDKLRAELGGHDVWLLVLDTRGVNVWCAAGKGTFGTAELVGRIQATNLGRVVDHRRLILPQLGAVGVAAHEVKRLSGFEVRVRPDPRERPPGLSCGPASATPAMRRVRFGWKQRLALVMTAIVSFMTLTFTGSTTFTTLAGVRLETRYASPASIAAAGAGVLCSVLAIWV